MKAAVQSLSLISASALLASQRGDSDVKLGTPCSLLGRGIPTEPRQQRVPATPPCFSPRLDKTWARLIALSFREINQSGYKGLPCLRDLLGGENT